MELEKGKLYQVNVGRRLGWVIAEYVSFVPAHRAHGLRGSDGATAWNEPAKHYFKSPLSTGPDYATLDRGMQTRPVTAETQAEIIRLKAEISDARSRWQDLCKQLRALCS